MKKEKHSSSSSPPLKKARESGLLLREDSARLKIGQNRKFWSIENAIFSDSVKLVRGTCCRHTFAKPCRLLDYQCSITKSVFSVRRAWREKTRERKNCCAREVLLAVTLARVTRSLRNEENMRGSYKVFCSCCGITVRFFLEEALKEARKGFSLLYCLRNEGRLQRRMFNGVGKLYVSLQLYCWAIL